MNLCNYDEIRALLGRHGFHFSKSLGQNFLIDPEVPYDIAASSLADETCGVLEIGPGIGPLTEQLAKRANKVVSIELDSALLPVLAETMASYPNVEIIHGDVLKIDLNALASDKFQGLTPIVCANLPYNITSPILAKLVETTAFETFTVLIQREVAQRICAKQGDSDGGSFSLFMQYYMETEVLFDVAPDRFLPAPKVTSSVLRCVRRKKPAVEVEDEAFFFKVMRGAFLLRRKTLCNSLASALPKVEKPHVAAALAELGLSENIRGERLTLQNFADLAKILAPYQ
ncbi:16S rRNA (adenine(1518)-N(6)/adenine(1519)-N(6))-dimethyltransferase RsmA [Bengtsoniella intestinalis]|uniref:16S rRNA (adenine(1518)-N(6)/adenine(1519)-N(6))- dimethyltransferase RsmA n=1 Tax=Bengtsoniella intestinalis TaxID=3073143 RepID=UPI00391EFB96